MRTVWLSPRSGASPLLPRNSCITATERPTATIETTKIAATRTTALAHSAGRRRGTAARVERIIPVEYSPVMTSTPRTTTASCARSAARVNTKTLLPLASCPVSCDATTAENNVTIPTIKKTVIPSVQTVERRVRNLIHSDLTMRGKLSRMSPVAGLACEGVAVGGIMTLVLIGLRLPCCRVQAGGGRLVLDAVLGEGHVRVLQGACHGGELMQHEPGSRGDLADRLGGAAGDLQALRGARRDADAGPGQQLAEPGRLGATYAHGRGARTSDDVGDRGVGQHPSASDDDDVVGGEGHLAHDVRGEEDRTSLAGEEAHQVANPQDPFGVESVRGLVQDERVRVAEQRGGDTQPLRHAQREAADPLSGDRLEPGHLDDLPHPGPADAVRRGHREQVVVCAAPGVHRLGVEQRADLLHGGAVLVVAPAVDGHRAARGVVQTDDQPHRGGLPGAVRAEETGDFAGLHGERDIVHGLNRRYGAKTAVGLDHRWDPSCLSGDSTPRLDGHPAGCRSHPLLRSTAFNHCWYEVSAASRAPRPGSKRRSRAQVAAISSWLDHTPVPRPARNAAPRPVVSAILGRSTGTSS